MRALALVIAVCSAAGFAWAVDGGTSPREVVMSSAEREAKITAVGRPRLLFQAKELAQLRQAIQTTHREEWEQLKAAVDHVLDDDPPENRPIGGDPTRPGTPNDEMLWQRVFGYRIPALALVALLDSDPKYFAAARRWALKPGEYPLWGAGVFEGTDLAAGHELYGISIAYDWLYDRWSPEDREQLKQILADHGKVMYEAAAGINDRGWWKETWRQNHAWCNYAGLGVTAIALAGDVPGMGEWLIRAEYGYSHIVAELPAEGAYEEGVPYWGYGMESLMRFITAARPYLDTDFYASPYLRRTHLFRLYLAGSSMGSIVNFGDGPTRDWHAITPLLFRLAAEYRLPLAQWLGKALPERRDADSRLYDLLWYDPSVSPEGPETLPLWHAFKTTGFAGARTSWEEEALTLHLRSGRTSVSHSHLDINNFLLNAGGDWLLRDYGYGRVGPGYFSREVDYFSNDTAGHNCLVIGERNQRKDDASHGVITDAVEQDGVVWFRSDATQAYEGVESVSRELALIQPHAGTGRWGAVVVRDLARTKQPETFDFMLQPGGDVTTDGDTFTIKAENARLLGKVLAPAGVTITLLPGIGDHINVRNPNTLRISAPGKARSMEFFVVLVALAEGETALEITSPARGAVQIGPDKLSFSADGTKPPQRPG